ncbi:MAG: TadE family protein, partial [Chloroflexota bacterium]|nr:TadE family protein [Chloroflexota bacterium]
MKTRRETSRDGERRKGQGIVEFALVLPILLLLLFGIIEFGRIFQAWLTIENAARQAARFAVSGQ